MTTLYAIMLQACGLSQQEAADFHKVRLDTVKSWSAGRRPAPDGAIAELRALFEKIETAADSLIDMIEGHDPEAEIEIGYAADNHEAQSLGWPCAGAQFASIALAAMYIAQPIRLVPRGSTTATAAAADIHQK